LTRLKFGCRERFTPTALVAWFRHKASQGIDLYIKMKIKRLFNTFKRNQIRWALMVYKWIVGVSWNQYHLDILHELGKGKENDLAISNKDVKRFVVENAKVGSDKLEIYENFIHKVLPDYLSDDNEAEHMLSTCKSASIFTSFEAWKKDNYVQPKNNIWWPIFENNVFCYAKSDIEKFNDSNEKNLITGLDFLVVRQIAESPFLFLQMFSIDIPSEMSKTPTDLLFPLKASAKNGKELIRSDVYIKLKKIILSRVFSEFQSEDWSVSNYRKGIMVPYSQNGVLLRGECFISNKKKVFIHGEIHAFTQGSNKLQEPTQYNRTYEPDHFKISNDASPLTFKASNQDNKTLINTSSDHAQSYYSLGELSPIQKIAFDARFSLL